MQGLCHTCYSSNVEIKLDKDSRAICTSCFEERAATERKRKLEATQ
jgi:predicted CXXCH cytochrome family protein